ncbi:MAG: hypothetical protein HOO00_01625 [Rhodospirillaceae bacterium]|nr:hypothetical protein [Rhodospirillaceae bacterium]MBT5659263.1 hypothetical protein [Rhodospirillaceae bacterium]MBT5752160.1 hypothetical protein [Rhodospirillaceae bacterium]
MDALMTQLVAGLFVWINLYTGYDIPDQVPEIIFIDHQQLEAMACEGPCPVLGFYDPARIIYLDNNLRPDSNLCAQSVLVHELIHFVQRESGQFSRYSAYSAWRLREREAHHFQKVFLGYHGRMHLFDRRLRLLQMNARKSRRLAAAGVTARAAAEESPTGESPAETVNEGADWRDQVQAYMGPHC